MRKVQISTTKTSRALGLIGGLALILVITYAAFIPALDNQFVSWDDQFYITNNPFIQNPTTESLKTLLTQVVSLNYHPLTMISLWVNAAMSGVDSAQPFIATNILIHLMNTALVFFLMMGLTDRKWIVAFGTAIIFGLHPMHVESVVWVSERKDVLYAFFLLSSLITYLKYIGNNRITWIASSLGLFILACLSKAMAVSLVPCLFLIDYLRYRDFSTMKLYIEKAPYIIIALITGLIAMNVQGGGDFYGLLTPSESANAMNSNLGLLDRVANAAYANTYYLKNFIYPSEFSVFHPYESVESISPLVTSGIGLGLMLMLLIGIVKGWREFVFSFGFYLATLLLVIQLIPVGSVVVAERYTYLPYIGLAYLLGVGLHKLYELKQEWIPASVVPLLTMMCFAQTSVQSDVWQDHTTLFGQAVEQYPENPLIREYYASGLWTAGELDSALYHIEYAINNLGAVKSSSFELLANCHAELGNVNEAIAFYNEAIRLDEFNVIARYHRGVQLLEIDPVKAIQDFNYCEESENTYISRLIYAPRGRAYGMIAQFDQALRDLEQAITYFPDDIDNYLDRALTYEYIGRTDKAIDDYSYVLERNPEYNLANERMQAIESANL